MQRQPEPTVCSFGFRGPGEVGVFASRLPPQGFTFLDLSPPPLSAELAGGGPGGCRTLFR